MEAIREIFQSRKFCDVRYIQIHSVIIIIEYIFILCYSMEGELDESEGDCECGKDYLGTCSVCAHARACGVCDGCTVMRDEGRNIGSTGERWLAAWGDNNTNSN